MPARLSCKAGPMRGAEFDLDLEATLGRDPGNTIVLPVPAVSARHARIVWDSAAGSYFLEDLDSLNGTALDGEPVSGRERLGRLHVISFAGRIDFIYQGPEICARRARAAAAAGEPEGGTILEELAVVLPAALADRPTAPGGSDAGTALEEQAVVLPPALAGRPDAGAAGAPDGGTVLEERAVLLPAALAGRPAADAGEPEGTVPEFEAVHLPAALAGTGLILEVPGYGPEGGYPLLAGDNRVGRAPDCEVWIDSPAVSRLHAVLVVRRGEAAVRDAGSRNRTYLDGEPIEGEVAVAPGAALRFGAIDARLVRAPGAGEGGREPSTGDAG